MTVGLVITLENRIEKAIPDIVIIIDPEIFTYLEKSPVPDCKLRLRVIYVVHLSNPLNCHPFPALMRLTLTDLVTPSSRYIVRCLLALFSVGHLWLSSLEFIGFLHTCNNLVSRKNHSRIIQI